MFILLVDLYFCVFLCLCDDRIMCVLYGSRCWCNC